MGSFFYKSPIFAGCHTRFSEVRMNKMIN